MSDEKIGFIMREAAKNGVNLDYNSVKETMRQSARFNDKDNNLYIDGRIVARATYFERRHIGEPRTT